MKRFKATPVLSEYCAGPPSSSFPFDLRPHASLSEEMTVDVQGLSHTTADISAWCSETSALIDLLMLRFASSMRRQFSWFNGQVSGLISRHGDSVIRSFIAILFACGLFSLFTGSAYAQWIQTNGPYTGHISVNCLTVSSTNLLAGTQSGGVFRSTDNGISWIAANSGLTHPGVRAFAVSGTNLFAATAGGGIFRSTNDGTSWNAVNQGLAYTYLNTLKLENAK